MDTPMMRQYKEIKSQYQDYIVFFRLGDFYEMFYEDAKLCSRLLEIALTSRDNKVPMAGVPYHSAEQYIAKLVSKGYKVVICEQVEDPKTAKGIVKREVVKIITPGTITDGEVLEEKENNYLGSIYKDKDSYGLAFVDLSTGDFFSTEITSQFPYSELLNELAKFNASELLLHPTITEDKILINKLKENINSWLTPRSQEHFDDTKAKNLLESILGHDKIQELLKHKRALMASGCCLSYLEETYNVLIHIDNIDYYETQNFMGLDISCRKNLELTRGLRDGKKTGSLLGVLDNTLTSMGGRLLRRWVEQPLIDASKIIERQDAVEEFYNDFFLRSELSELLKDVYDLERLTGKLASGSANARDLLAIKSSVYVLPKVKQSLASCSSKLLGHLRHQLDPLDDVFQLIDASIAEDPPVSVKEGGIIKGGYHEEIDKLRTAARDGKTWIAELEKKERDRTGIRSLKVGFNRVFGYYIEVTKPNLALVPEDYSRKQTLANSERFITEELKEYETLILNAEDRLKDLEYEVFCQIRGELIKEIPRLKQSSFIISTIDALLSLAQAADKNNYVKPEITLQNHITIVEGRHPVVEYYQRDIAFIPNDTYIDNDDTMISIITGPNMAGKSTYMRQVALIVLMAQIGSFVPAKRASIGIVDKIFTRIGASDNLASGQSTFMVEMMEVSQILSNATEKSLIILDEVGRGTSTYDGLSIAWAVIEYIQEHLRAKTLFATHYYELTALEDLSGIKNFKITVKEKGEDVIFLRKIVPGKADKSYGIQVARLAGLPRPIIRRARQLLAQHENMDKAIEMSTWVSETTVLEDEASHMESLIEQEVIQEIRELDINSMTPMEALNFLFSVKSKLE